MKLHPGKRSFYFLQQTRDWIESFDHNEAFLSRHEKRLKTIEFGSSFSPEYIEELYEEKRQAVPTQQEILDIFKIVIKEFKITNIRLGIRWNRVVKENGMVNIEYYKKFLEYCFDNNVNVILNIGPIKTFRWPEQYVPDFVLSTLHPLPPKGGVIDTYSPLAHKAFEYLDTLLLALQKEFTKEQLEHISAIQPENESFHKFGTYEWRFSEDYLEEVIKKVLHYLPHVGIMFNSSETRNLRQIWKLYERLLDHFPQLKKKLICGYNYYYLVPGRKSYPFIGIPDSISLTNIVRKRECRNNIICARHLGFLIEISEAQSEPWPPLWSPGNSTQQFRFMVVRCMNNILDPEVKSIIRIWGIERLAKAFYEKKENDDQRCIRELVKIVNTS